MATDEVVLEGGSRFLNKFIINQAKGALGGSGDDRYYYDQVISYFKKQPTVWIEFEKQARAEGHKEEREKVRCMGANCEKPPVWCNYAYHEQFENGKAIGRDECLFSNCEKCGETATVRVCNKCFAIERQAGREELENEWENVVINPACKAYKERINALETEKEHLIKQVEQLKYGESAGFKYNHSHPYPLCQGCVTEGREESKVCTEKCLDEHDHIKALEADKEIQATELRGKINEISVLSAKIRKLRRQPRSKKEGKK